MFDKKIIKLILTHWIIIGVGNQDILHTRANRIKCHQQGKLYYTGKINLIFLEKKENLIFLKKNENQETICIYMKIIKRLVLASSVRCMELSIHY